MIDNQVLIWLTAAVVAIATPLLGYLSPFGRARRGMVEAMQREIGVLSAKVVRLESDLSILNQKVDECERERTRLERENYRLYRELDGRIA